MDRPGTLRHVAVIEYCDAPIAWIYQRLGFRNCTSIEVPETAYISELSGGAWSEIRISKYANEYGSQVEIVSLPLPRGPERGNWNHIAVSVDDCSVLVADLVRGGAILTGGPVRSSSGPYLVAYLRDPSGNLIELVQRLW